MTAPIRLRHAAAPLLAMPRGEGFRLSIAIAEGYDPGLVASWRLRMVNRYETPKLVWIGLASSDIVTGQVIALDFADDAENDDLDASAETLADVTALGTVAWSLDALDGDDRPMWRIQGPVDFVGADSLISDGLTLGEPIPLDLGEGETITLTLLGNAAAGDAVEFDLPAAIHAATAVEAIADTAEFPLATEVEGEWLLGKATWTLIKSTLATAFGGVFAALSHKSRHATGQADAIAPSDIGALPANDASVTNARTPTAHKISHATGGTDAIAPGDIGAAAESHNQAISTVTGLQAALDAKVQPNSEGVISVTGSSNVLGQSGIKSSFGPTGVFFSQYYIALQAFGSWIFRNSDNNIPTVLNRLGFSTASGFSGSATICLNQESTTEISVDNGTSGQYRDFRSRDLTVTRYLRPASYTVSAANALSSPPEGSAIYVSNESGGARWAYRRGSSWLRFGDDATIS